MINQPEWNEVASGMLAPYSPILIFLAISAVMGLALVGLSLALGIKKPDGEKLSTYECGFEPFGNSRMQFDVRFYLVAILFIIFDLEVAFLFPWAVTLDSLGWGGFLSMGLFLSILTIGFLYEWRKGALEWE